MCMNVASTIAFCCSVATSLSEPLPNDGESPISQRGFCFQNAVMVNFHEAYILALNRSGIHKSILEGWLFWETGAFCKHKSSSLHNQAIEVIYSLPRSGRDA